jgi:protocatechuate 3,4-dioxygenase beta subunit
MNDITIITNKRIIVIAIVLSLSALTVLTATGGVGLASNNIASPQSILSNQGMVSPSPPGPFPGQFGPLSPELSATQISASTNQTCQLTPSLIEEEGTPQQIEGPYFVDDMPNRSDIRSDPSDGSVQQGVPLRLALHVYDVDNGSCIPLSGAQVDVWHANSQGVYSGVQDSGTGGMMYLRGSQVTDDNGTVRFTTVYPGWYEGRAIHIHIKVRTFEGSEKTLEWTSQFYLNNSISEQVHTQPPYSNHGLPEVTNEEDMIYRGASSDGLVQSNTGEHLMLNLTKDNDEQSYLGTFNIVLNSGQPKQ